MTRRLPRFPMHTALGLTLGLVIAMTPATPAHAQEVMTFTASADFSPMGGSSRPSISRRELDRYWEILSMDGIQRELADSMYEAFRSDFERESDKLQDEMSELRAEYEETEDFTVFIEDMPKLMSAFQKESDKLTKGFFDDVRSLLTEEQGEKWPVIERSRRRLKLLPFGNLAGESVDLFNMAEELKLSDASTEKIDPVLEQYDIEMDRALQDREQRMEEAREKHGGGGGMHMFTEIDIEEMQAESKEAHELSLRIRDINRRYFRLMSAELTADESARADERFQRLSYPQVYRESYSVRVFDAVKDFEDLSSGQQDRLSALRERYERDLETVNRQWAGAIEESESEGGGSMMQLGGGRSFMIGDNESEELKDARQARRKLDREVLDNLKAMLTEAQVDRLPRRREGRADAQSGQFQVMEIEVIEDGS